MPRQFRRARKECRKLKKYLGRVIRDIRRKQPHPGVELAYQLLLADRLFAQQPKDKNKLYSVHAPEVECIGKGKAHKRYEFGCKASYVTSAKSNWVLGALAFHGNPYDGHTLRDALAQTTGLLGIEPEMVICDLGYRGHNYSGDCDVQVVNRYRKKVPASLKRWWKRRNAVEPVIGHMKEENRLCRNRLKGKSGDKINAVLAGAGFNMRKLLKAMSNFLALFGKCLFRALFDDALACFASSATLAAGRSIHIQHPLLPGS